MGSRLSFLIRRYFPISLLSLFLGLVLPPLADSQDVLTYHNNPARQGLNNSETILTPANVNSASFGLQFNLQVDGKVDAQPLYASNVVIPGKGTYNLLIVATEHGSVYAFAARLGTKLWQVSVLKSGETPADSLNCDQIVPEIGVTATPVISRSLGPNGAIYVVAMSKDGSGNYHQRLHALDLTTGAELFKGPKEIQASYPGSGDGSSNGRVIFDPKQHVSRPGLLLLNNVVYTAWGSHCDVRPYSGWVIGYNASTLVQQTVLNLAPNGSGAAVWMGSTGIAGDPFGNICVMVGNGDFDTNLNSSGFPKNGNYGNAFVRLSTAGGLAVADYFTMHNQQQENNADIDLGSGGVMILPQMTDSTGKIRYLAVGAGKDTNIYLVGRYAMGKFNPNVHAGLTGEQALLRVGEPSYLCLSVFQCPAAAWSGHADQQQLPLSRRHSFHIGKQWFECYCVGRRECRDRCAACLSGVRPARNLQQQPGRQLKRSLWKRQQVHHPYDCRRAGFRRDNQQRWRVRAALVWDGCGNRFSRGWKTVRWRYSNEPRLSGKPQS
jgi:hypothetical protein